MNIINVEISSINIALDLSRAPSSFTTYSEILRTMGLRKVEMKKIKNNSFSCNTFSKHQVGLFKKANELVALCAVQIAILIYLPAGTPYSFASPNVDEIFSVFLKSTRKQQ